MLVWPRAFSQATIVGNQGLPYDVKPRGSHTEGLPTIVAERLEALVESQTIHVI